MGEKFVSIIIHAHNEERIIKKSVSAALKQKYLPKEIIVVNDNSEDKTEEILKSFGEKIKILNNNKNRGLSGSINKGIKNSKGEIIVTLLADCVPYSENWLKELIEPFKSDSIVATSSKVNNPPEIFDKQEEIVRCLFPDERGEYVPGLDEKGCAYRKDVLIKVGLFDESSFKTAGEDFDMTYKMENEGVVLRGVSKVNHLHPLTLEGVIKRHGSYGGGFGVLFRKYGHKIEKWVGGVLRSIFPFWALYRTFKIKKNFPHLNMKDLFVINLKMNQTYSINFWRSFIKKSQW